MRPPEHDKPSGLLKAAGAGTTATGRVASTGIGFNVAAAGSLAGATGAFPGAVAGRVVRRSDGAPRFGECETALVVGEASRDVRRGLAEVGTQLGLLLAQILHHRGHLGDEVEHLDLVGRGHRAGAQVRRHSQDVLLGWAGAG